MDIDDVLIASTALGEDTSEATKAPNKLIILIAILAAAFFLLVPVWLNTSAWRVQHLPAAFSSQKEKQDFEMRRAMTDLVKKIQELAN
jgi:hypothetical protein